MSNINQIIFKMYQNIHVFYKYRELIPIDEPITNAILNEKVQKYKYIVMRSISKHDADHLEKIKNLLKDDKFDELKDTNVRIYYLIILYPNTDYNSKRPEFKKILSLVPYKNSDIMIVTKDKIGKHMLKFIYKLNETSASQKIYVYEYALFKTIIPEYSLAPKYTILSKDEIEKELSQFHIQPNNLSRVLESDPQMVWIGAKVGQVVKYEYLSEVTIKSIGYSVVIPSNDV